MENGWISLHRSILKWEWYSDANTFRLFVHLLLSANHDDNRYMGHEVKRGSLVVGINKLSATLNLSTQQLRTALNKLKSTKEITIKTTNKFSIITICKYNNYQSKEGREQHTEQQSNNKRATNEQQTSNKQVTTNNKNNNKKNNNNGRMKESLRESPENYFKQEIPYWLNTDAFKETWLEWCGFRKETKKKLTKISVKQQIKKLANMGEVRAIAALENSIANGYQGIVEPKSSGFTSKTKEEKAKEVYAKFLGEDKNIIDI